MNDKTIQDALVDSEIRYRRLFETAKDGILLLREQTGVIEDVNPFLVELLGIPREDLLGRPIWELGFFGDIIASQASFLELQSRKYIRYEDKPLRAADGRRIDVEFISNVYESNGVPVIQCNVRDVSARRQAERALRTALSEQAALLKEVHHRVKNNLQVICSLLRIERSRATNAGTVSTLNEMVGRVQSMALLHETLYRSGSFAAVDLADYITRLSGQLFAALSVGPSILLKLNLAPAFVSMDQALPCGLIINELVSNCFKHAFWDGVSGDVCVELQPVAGGAAFRLSVSDSGRGVPADFESRRAAGLGLQLVSDLARQLGGTLEVGYGAGARFSLDFVPNVATHGASPTSA